MAVAQLSRRAYHIESWLKRASIPSRDLPPELKDVIDSGMRRGCLPYVAEVDHQWLFKSQAKRAQAAGVKLAADV